MSDAAPGETRTRTTLSSPDGPPSLSAAGRALLLVFALAFPLATAWQRTESNQIKFFALAGFALLLGAALFCRFRAHCASWLADRRSRLAVVVWLVLSGYAVFFLGFSLPALLFSAVFLVIVQAVACRKWLQNLVSGRILVLLALLTLDFVLCSFGTTDQYTALGGSYYRKTGL
ncbi:MAG: hypothetical protein KGR98_15690, partial [Verrucomicrobia bacterium]|nr:hypothetical protein [Verrucomicrobiota bacterium]